MTTKNMELNLTITNTDQLAPLLKKSAGSLESLNCPKPCGAADLKLKHIDSLSCQMAY